MNEMIAYCGVDCSVCPDLLGHICPGCRKTDWSGQEPCMPVACCRDRGIPFCGKCVDFPCREMEDFYQESESHRQAYHRMKNVGRNAP